MKIEINTRQASFFNFFSQQKKLRDIASSRIARYFLKIFEVVEYIRTDTKEKERKSFQIYCDKKKNLLITSAIA